MPKYTVNISNKIKILTCDNLKFCSITTKPCSNYRRYTPGFKKMVVTKYLQSDYTSVVEAFNIQISERTIKSWCKTPELLGTNFNIDEFCQEFISELKINYTCDEIASLVVNKAMINHFFNETFKTKHSCTNICVGDLNEYAIIVYLKKILAESS